MISGEAWTTQFQIKCSNWTDPDDVDNLGEPLSYTVYSLSSESSASPKPLFETKGNILDSSVVLNSGLEADLYKVTVLITIADTEGGEVTQLIIVKVHLFWLRLLDVDWLQSVMTFAND